MTSTRPLQGQKAIVTGANSGIGRAVAIALGGAGADVVVNHRDGEDAAMDVVRTIAQAGSRALAHRADISREAEVKELFQRAIEHFGTVDILVNNAGLQRDAPFEELTLEQWNTVIGVNLTGQFLCAREAVREFKRRGVVESVSKAAGKIICISSVHEVIPWAGHVNYSASKGGVMLMMKSLAQEVAPDRIRVNSNLARRDPHAHQQVRLEHAGGICGPPAARALQAHRRTRGHRQGRNISRLR